MHQILVTLFAMIVSLCSHSAMARPVDADAALITATPSPALSFPDRRDLARAAAEASYADSACLSCQRMNVSYTAR